MLVAGISVLFPETGSVSAETIRVVEDKVLVEGKLGAVTTGSVVLEGKRYPLDGNYSILDGDGNPLPDTSLKNAEIVRLEVSHGYVQKIYVIVLPR